MARRLLTWLAYPLLTGGSLVFAAWALASHWPAWSIGIFVVAFSMLYVAIFEKILPYSKAWTIPRNDFRTDVWHALLSNRAFDIGTFIAISTLTPVGNALSRAVGFRFWPHDWPLAAQFVLAFILVELPWYWIHRLEHTWEPLWRLHSVHHSCQRIYWWNLGRNHPFDNLISAFASMGFMSILGVGEAPLALVAAYSGAHAMLQHSNVDQQTGFLDWIFSTARVHRWHHSAKLEESMANYGPTLTLWDLVFRSRKFSPELTPPEDVGLGPLQANYPEDYLGQLLVPFEAERFRTSATTPQ